MSPAVAILAQACPPPLTVLSPAPLLISVNMEPAKKLSQAEMLEAMSPAPFDQRNRVPASANIQKAPDSRWWRSDSPRGEGEPPDGGVSYVDPNNGATRGVLGHGQRSGPSCYQTQYSAGVGSAAHFKTDQSVPPTISGFSGHIAGKYAGNCVGGTYTKTNEDAVDHLKGTAQTLRYGATAIKMNQMNSS